MLSVNPWRGPDASGSWGNDRVGLAHLRLSIIDPGPEANQPMIDPHGRVLVFGGEIYNYRELRREIGSRYTFRTRSDSEVILAAYHVWGHDCVTHFNGDWAFAIYDPGRAEVFLSRDRFGIKPLFVHKDGSRLVFGSEVRSLLEAGIPRIVPLEHVFQFVRYRKTEFRYTTLVRDVYPLEPGSNLTISLDRGTALAERYYGPDQILGGEPPNDEREATAAFGDLLRDAVSLRLRADVPLGVLLSGGLDSSAIANLVASEEPDTFKTFSAVFPSSAADESRYSRAVAADLGTEHVEISPSPDDFFEHFDSVIEAQDGPCPSPRFVARYMTYERSSDDVKVVLEGQGGDEAFGGYEACYRIYRQLSKERGWEPLQMTTGPKEPSPPSAVTRFHELLPEHRHAAELARNKKDAAPGSTDPFTSKQYDLLRNNLVALLHTGDRLQMHNSIEGRYPFLDHRLIEFCFACPVGYRISGHDKLMLRRWAAGSTQIPREVVWRTDKKGFPSIHDTTLREERARPWFKERLEALIRDEPGIFDLAATMELVEEQSEHGVNNVQRLLGIISLLSYLRHNRLEVEPTGTATETAS